MNRATAAAVVAGFAAAVAVTVVQPLSRSDVDAGAFVAALQKHNQDVKPGDTVLVHPPWRDDAVAAVKGAGLVQNPVTEAFAPRHGDPWPPLVVLADDRWPLPRALRDRVVVVDDAGDVDVYRVAGDSDGATPDLAQARVSVVERDGSVVDCPWDASRRRHVCAGLPEWMTVGDDTLVVSGKNERCTWAHPKSGARLVVDYGEIEVAPDGKGSVVVEVALSDAAVKNKGGAAVAAVLAVDDEEERVVVQKKPGFQRARVDVDDKARARVRLELTTDNDGQRHTCYRLRVGGGR